MVEGVVVGTGLEDQGGALDPVHESLLMTDQMYLLGLTQVSELRLVQSSDLDFVQLSALDFALWCCLLSVYYGHVSVVGCCPVSVECCLVSVCAVWCCCPGPGHWCAEW